MKPIIMTVAMSLVAALGVMGQSAENKTPTVKCTQANGAACTAGHVQSLSSAMKAAAKGSKPLLAGVRSVSLASGDGTLKCTQTNGKACTIEQAQALHEVSATMPISLSLY